MTRPMYIFRQSPSDPCLIEWRRNEVTVDRGLRTAGQNSASRSQSAVPSPQSPWLYWCRCQTAEEALEALAAIERAGLVIERQEVRS
jgi:hypothetical protein